MLAVIKVLAVIEVDADGNACPLCKLHHDWPDLPNGRDAFMALRVRDDDGHVELLRRAEDGEQTL